MIRFMSDWSERYDLGIFRSACVRCWFSASGNLILRIHREHIAVKLDAVFDSNGLLNPRILDFLGSHVYDFIIHMKEKNINVEDFEQKFQELCP